MIAQCPKCGAELGPWENDAGCVTCESPWRWSLADRAVAALEQAPGPLYRWDIKREMRRVYTPTINEGSLNTSLANDWRTCWAGPGLYGLYRHGLLPGVRDIGSAAGVFIHAAGRSLSMDEIRFILRFVGYRITAGSLPQAVARVTDDGMFSWTWGRYIGRSESEKHQRAAARALRLGRRGPVFREVAARARAQTDTALAERERRLRRSALSNGRPHTASW